MCSVPTQAPGTSLLLFHTLAGPLELHFLFLDPVNRMLVPGFRAAHKQVPGRARGASWVQLCSPWEGDRVFAAGRCCRFICAPCVQVVAGMNYFLEVEIGRTTCTKSQANLDNCPFPNQPDLQKVCV